MCRRSLALLVLLALSFGVASGQEKTPALPRVSLGLGVEEMPDEGPHGGLVVRHVLAAEPANRAGVAGWSGRGPCEILERPGGEGRRWARH